jgi:protein disulfide-isomerase A6
MGVQGFPTLKTVKPGKKPNRPIVEDYQGPRSAKAIVDYMVDKIPNHVTKVDGKKLKEHIEGSVETPKAILFTNKGKTSALYRSLAIDFLGSISFAQVRDEKSAAEYGVTVFPTLVLFPGEDKEKTVYDGEMKKEPMTAFLSQVASPNPDPPAKKSKAKKTAEKKKKTEKASDKQKPIHPEVKKGADPGSCPMNKGEKADAAGESCDNPTADANAAKASAANVMEEVLEDTETVPSPDAPVKVPKAVVVPALPIIETIEDLKTKCVSTKSTTCILLLEPSGDEDLKSPAYQAKSSLAQISNSYAQRKAKLFPFYVVPASNTGNNYLRNQLDKLLTSDQPEIIALNTRRGWWRKFSQDKGMAVTEFEKWIDEIRMGDGKKEDIKEGVVEVTPQEKAEKADAEDTAKIQEAIDETLEELNKNDLKEEKKNAQDIKDEL